MKLSVVAKEINNLVKRMTELEPIRIKQKSPRKNRRKRRRSKSTSSEEEWFSSDESIYEDKIDDDQKEQQFASGPWTYDLDAVLMKKEFEFNDICREMNASDFTIDYLQENGLEEPVLFKDSLSALGMKMPKDGTFTVRCVLKAVGDRLVEVVDVMTQGSRQMMLSDFVDYYESPSAGRKDLLNLLSLEFSLTPLSKRVRGPTLAQEIDWVELYWPKDLRNSPSTFPKVQNYCLMSVKGSFTDFHIDFGGTSVWYHIYKGRKTFWIIEPTEENILKYEKWILEGSQHEAFFGDLVDKCARIELYEGYTFIIPSGWIHAVYTPEDSLVFGGNFLHSFSIPMQIRVIRSENILMIKKKYRYPNYIEMVWYVIENIVKKTTGCIYKINKMDEALWRSSDQKVDSNALKAKTSVNADGILMHVDNTAGSATNNDIGKEADNNIVTNRENTIKMEGNTVDSTVGQAQTEETALFDEKTNEKNLCPEKVRVPEYLATISQKERDGFKSLLVYMREIVKNQKNSANQEKNDLLNVFEKVLNHKVPEYFIVEKGKKKNVEQQSSPKLNQWLKAFGKNKSPIAKRKIPPKEKVTETQQFTRPKPPKSKVKSNKKPDYHKPDGPLIVGGIPPAIMPADAPQAPNPYGYDPLASVTPLGHKQLPSAYRRTPDMAKAPPSQKFRLQPQLHKVVVDTSGKMEAMPEKTSDKSWSTGVTSIPGPSNDNKSTEYEIKTMTVAQADTERSIHHNESWRSHRDRDKDNQRENRCTVKEKYPELQYRSPLVRPGPSNRRTNVFIEILRISSASKLGQNSYRCSGKTFKRRYTDSFSAADCWSIGSRGIRRASDCDSKKNEYSTSWRSETYHKSNSTDMSSISSQSFLRSWPKEVSTIIQHNYNYSVPGDPRLSSAEGLSRWSSATKVAPVKDHERDGNLPVVQPTRKQDLNITTTVMNSTPRTIQKMSSPVGLIENSQYIPLLNRERNLTPASVSGVDTSMQYVAGITLTLVISESHGNAAIESVKSLEEIKKPEIRDLSITLNEDKEDGAEIMMAAEELAELTKVFDVDERDLEKKRTGPLTVTVEQKKLKRQNLDSSERTDDAEESDLSPPEIVEADSVSSLSGSSKIPTETVLQNLSSLTAEFNAVVD
uniref:JmjC domain-containing protein n=1 Tax=Onchocerca volvulus TaxID=6282 RepID=A0A8R1U0Z4_ONCVO